MVSTGHVWKRTVPPRRPPGAPPRPPRAPPPRLGPADPFLCHGPPPLHRPRREDPANQHGRPSAPTGKGRDRLRHRRGRRRHSPPLRRHRGADSRVRARTLARSPGRPRSQSSLPADDPPTRRLPRRRRTARVDPRLAQSHHRMSVRGNDHTVARSVERRKLPMTGITLNRPRPLRPRRTTPVPDRTTDVHFRPNPSESVQNRTQSNRSQPTNLDISQNCRDISSEFLSESSEIYPNLDKSGQIWTPERPISSSPRQIVADHPKFSAASASDAEPAS